jgi:hypothetical protein
MSAAVADSEGLILLTPLKMEVQLHVLDEGMMQAMSLVVTALKRAVQQWQLWAPDEGMMQAMFLVVAALKRVAQQWQS